MNTKSISVTVASALAIATATPAWASPDTVNSPTGGTLPAGVTPIGGIVVDLLGTNDNRVVSQLPASQLYRGYANSSENPVPGVASGNPLLFGTQTGYDTATIGALGGGIKSVSVRLTLFDGDTAPGDFDYNDNTLSLNNIEIGNWSAVTTYQTSADGLTTTGSSLGFPNDTLATGFFSSTDAALLANLYNSLVSSNAIAFTLTDVDPYDNFFDFTQGINGGLINIGTGPVVTPPTPTGTFNYWDGDAAGNANNGAVDGGNGVWNATNPNWTEATGTTNGPYSPNPTNAIFQGAPGTVIVDDSAGQIAVTGLTFNVDGYILQGDPIALSGANVAIAVNNDPSFTATINNVLTGASGLTKTGPGSLVLGGLNTYTGPTEVAAGSLGGYTGSFGTGSILIDSGAALYLDEPTSSTFGNVITGPGTLYKVNVGTLKLTQDDSGLTGPTNVLAGTLLVDGNLSNSPVLVATGARLGGTGTVGGIGALGGATVAPGDPGAVGTLGVTGAFGQAAGSTYAVDLTTAGAGDLLSIGGAATLDPGARLVVTKLDPSNRYVLGRRYTVLTAAGGRTGTYALSGNTAVSLFYNLVATYDPTHVYLDVAQTSSFASAGLTFNEIEAAGGADSHPGALHDAIGNLQTVDQAREAFDSISGEIYATNQAAAFEDSRFVREAVYGHLVEPGAGRLWYHAFGSFGHMKGDGNAARYHRNIGGGFMGFDVVNGPTTKIGALIGYDHSFLKVPARGSSAVANTFHAGAYAGFNASGFGIRVGGDYGFRDIDVNRSISFTGFSDSAHSSYNLRIAQAFGEVGYKIPLGGAGAGIEPIGGIAYVHLSNHADSEVATNSALTIYGDKRHVLFTTAGARLNAGVGPVHLTGTVAWRHAMDGRLVLAPLAFSGGGSLFYEAATPLAKDVAAVDLGADVGIAKNMTFNLSYSGQIGDNLRDHGAKAQVSFVF